jgi:hypothetical protein
MDVGTALYYDSIVHNGDEPLKEYITSTDARFESGKLGFFNASGEPLQFKVEKLSDERYALYVSLPEPIRKGSRLNIYAKALMGGKVWMEVPHHKMLIERNKPAFFDGFRGPFKSGCFSATLWKMPKGCKLFEIFPQPWEIHSEDDRLNVLFVFFTSGPNKMYLKYVLSNMLNNSCSFTP